MTTAECAKLTGPQMEAIAWGFLRSEFTQQIYAAWPMDRRIAAYLHHQGLDQIIDDGSAFDQLTERVMANLGSALRSGLLGLPKDRS
ncbi:MULTISPECIES: hypothetical protein [unclassified Mycolicibacterium]|uniref:hypothetical protein n=1 Tax=unclassified Mycolicibacterium TaxID=2636767 RepID=UPI002EDB5009